MNKWVNKKQVSEQTNHATSTPLWILSSLKKHKSLYSSWVISLAGSVSLHIQQTLQCFLDRNRHSRFLWCSEIASHPFHSVPIATNLIQIQVHITKSSTFSLHSNPSSTLPQIKLPFISLCLHYNSSNCFQIERKASLFWHAKLSTIWHLLTFPLLSPSTSQHIL